MNNQDKPVTPGKDFAKVATASLSDEDVTRIGEVVADLVTKYAYLAPTEDNLAKLDDEAVDRLHGLGYLAHVDIEPVLSGKPPVIDIIGRVGDIGFQKPFDHEKGQYDVQHAHKRGEYFYGEKEAMNPVSKAKKRTKNFQDGKQS